MGKKKKAALEQEGAGFANNPFAALQGLEVPAGEPKSTAVLGSQVEDRTESQKWPAKIVLRREKKGRGGKTVTFVSGLEAERLETVAQDIKRALGCGARVEGCELVLHGSLVDRAAKWFEDHGAPQVVRGN